MTGVSCSPLFSWRPFHYDSIIGWNNSIQEFNTDSISRLAYTPRMIVLDSLTILCFAVDLRLIIPQGEKTSENRRFSLGKLALVRRSINTHARSLFLPWRLLLSRTGSRSAFPPIVPSHGNYFRCFRFSRRRL